MTQTAVPGSSGLSQRVRYRLLGLSMLVVIALLLALTVALFNKALTPVTKVQVQTERAGLQLLPRSDVKVRGLIVGEVRSTKATESGATINLALDPDKAKLIPNNVQARLIPKTLFGEKYVDLEIPTQPGPVGLHKGQVIQQDKSQPAVEIDKVLNNLLPLLQAVKPEKLNATLNALATALQGRGDQIGSDIEQADALLKKINPQLGTLVYDLNALSDTSDIYSDAAPDLLQTLRNLNVTSKTITDKQATIEDIIPQVTGTAQKGERFMLENGPKIVGVNIANRDGLDLFARYAPSFPCLFKGMEKGRAAAEAAGGGKGPTFNLTIEIVKPRPAYKYPLDLPEAKDQRGPRCWGLPNPKVPFPEPLARDGLEDDLWWKNPDPANAPANANGKTPANGQNRGRAASGVFLDPGSMSQKDNINSVIGPMTRTPADEVPDLGQLLFGPLLQGSVVTVK
ncbi:MCE family protein [Actinomadura barringtoniae]|uniref:MCE family protein n=1 Tax=Actinomadura barringtoniae TaxID=1427535 RepID=A0A939T6W3_9ACTN|nr:MCE family protein [Actinomadura barringtoniae]MBO2451329.1 MCE family protein [Actinomadura barringtoniae]